MKTILKMATAVSFGLSSYAVSATTLTEISPVGTNVTVKGASSIGGIVTELKGINGVSVVSQVAASSLFRGFSGGNNPLTIGTQTGFNSTVVSALGGGLASASFRFTLFDGDTAAGNFDVNDVNLLVNGIDVGNWSDVTTNTTDNVGALVPGGSDHLGFRDDKLDSGWFHVTNSAQLASFFTSLSSSTIRFALNDVDPGDNFFDFTQGIDSSLINVGSGPVVVPPSSVPVPAAAWLFGSAVLGMVGMRKRKTA